ncbi:MAG TPA: peroxiredoxin family protein [Vicinamibacterales bacterium]|nr:peroxiredoxin family protein [Vicinamibacterales bacterium]
MATQSDLKTAPPFVLPNQKGQRQSLQDYLQRGPVLLAFHRGTWCPNCRRKFGELAKNSPAYVARGVQVVTVVAQASDVVRRYVEDSGVPFNILIDESRDVLKAYGVWHRLGLDAWNIARPALFLIDRTGTIHYSFVGERQDEFPTNDEILAQIARLEGGSRV